MPYKNIHWVKLEKRLLDDYRFYSMSEQAQLLFVKLLLVAAATNNKIPYEPALIKTMIRSSLSESDILLCIEEIHKNFPKFKKHQGHYIFVEWSNRHNQIFIEDEDIPGISPGKPQNIPKITKQQLDIVLGEYIKLKRFDIKSIKQTEWGRFMKRSKELLVRAKGNTNLVIEAMNRLASSPFKAWTLETVDRQWLDFLRDREISQEVPAASKEVDLSCLGQ